MNDSLVHRRVVEPDDRLLDADARLSAGVRAHELGGFLRRSVLGALRLLRLQGRPGRESHAEAEGEQRRDDLGRGHGKWRIGTGDGRLRATLIRWPAPQREEAATVGDSGRGVKSAWFPSSPSERGRLAQNQPGPKSSPCRALRETRATSRLDSPPRARPWRRQSTVMRPFTSS